MPLLQWCYLRECVPQGTTSIAVNGGWGDWGPASECSRTCGGGMSVIQRKCDNPQPSYRGKYCLGDRNRYSLCNTDPCPKGDVPFLDYQCAQWNDVLRRGEKHTWTAFTEKKNANPCSLVCINENNIYAVLSTRVIDGTNCKAGTKNKCISGVCR
ncbi:unnamed protein product, partial [Timema podura]|nr:unnamed protein product [Timema podura]